MVDLIVLGLLVLAAGLCGYVLYRHRDREPFNPTIARESQPREPRTGKFWDESAAGGI